MNDRYLYRAKHVHALSKNEHLDGRWIEGYLSDENYIYSPSLKGEFLIDPSTICQCAGSKDRNGKKIYEKNIVRDEDGSVGIVEFGVWNDYSIGFYIRWLSGNAKYYRNELGYWAPKVEIIGSAFDNLELSEVGE